MMIMNFRFEVLASMKYTSLVCLLLAFLILSSSAFAEDLALARASKYPLSENGEAMVNDVEFFGSAASGHQRVFYEIFVSSFSDSNGDGIGDLRGIINRMDYLNDGDPQSGLSLGVEGLWLTPIFASPSYHKYDVADYYSIDPSFGSEEDLIELLALCHERNVLVILDLPINHTGDQNKWFQNFKNAHLLHNPDSIYYDLYSWVESGGKVPAGRHFTSMRGTNESYESNFSDNMPELNYDNELARSYALDVAKYYLNLGVDGFRFDAAKYIYFGDHKKSAEFWNWYTSELRKIKSDVYLVGEVWDSDGVTDLYETAFNCFNFTTSQASGLIAETAKAGNANRFTAYVQEYAQRVKSIREDACYTPFIANHDTDRAAGYLTVSNGQAKMAANLYLLGPGSPFIYYGEEIGLRGSRGGANTDANRRLKMLWGDGDTVQNPIGATYDDSKQTPYSVKDLLSNGDSLYTHYKRLLMLRNANPEIYTGVYRALDLKDTKLGGFVSSAESGTVAVLHNATNRELRLSIESVPELGGMSVAAFIGLGEASLSGDDLTVGGQTSVILRK